jgi:hypothetical protein
VAGTVQTMDTASTALFLLGVDKPAAWMGTIVRSAFKGTAVNTQ